MNEMERLALQHAAEWLKYQRSPQAAIDLARDKRRRAAANIAAGHTPQCSLTKCVSECPSLKGK